MPNPFELSPSLAAKIGSIVAHVDEATGADGHEFDVVAARALVNLDDVQEWLAELRKSALIPARRN